MWWVLVVVSLNGPLRFWSLYIPTRQGSSFKAASMHLMLNCWLLSALKTYTSQFDIKIYKIWLMLFLVPIRWCGQSQRLNFIICTSNPSVINHCHYQKLGFPIAFCFTFLFNTHFTLVHFRMSLIIIFPQKNGKGADERTIQELEDNIISVSENNSYLSKYLIDE